MKKKPTPKYDSEGRPINKKYKKSKIKSEEDKAWEKQVESYKKFRDSLDGVPIVTRSGTVETYVKDARGIEFHKSKLFIFIILTIIFVAVFSIAIIYFVLKAQFGG